MWKDATGAIVPVVAVWSHAAQADGQGYPAGGTIALLVADANGVIWAADATTGERTLSITPAGYPYFTSLDCSGAVYVAVPGMPRLAFAGGDGNVHYLPDGVVPTHAPIKSALYGGQCSPSGPGPSGLFVPASSAPTIQTLPTVLFSGPAHAEFVP